MFNVLARQQFTAKLLDIGLTQAQHPSVDTFHSFAFKIMRRSSTPVSCPNPKSCGPPTTAKWATSAPIAPSRPSKKKGFSLSIPSTLKWL
jgi:hypothetical protein